MNDAKLPFAPLAGYAADIWAKVSNRPFVPHSLQKLRNLALCRDLSDGRTAIEIGTYKGVTARRLSYLFDRVVTIEIDPALVAIARKRCAGRTNIEVLQGDGSVLLDDALAKSERAVLFLDGHFSGGDTSMVDEVKPIMRELEAIAPRRANVAGVVIDDFRLFGTVEGWPSRATLFAKLEALFPHPDWRMLVQYDQIIVARLPPAR